MAITALTLLLISLVIFVCSFPNLRRVVETWNFLLRGRVIMLSHVRKNPHKAFSLPIPGNKLHVMCTKDHWKDLNNAQTNLLSPNAASREMFQPKYTFGFDWGAPREHISLATVRSIRNMTAHLPNFQGKFVTILDEEFRKAFDESPQVEGWNRVSLWPTLQRAITRINSLVILGENIANNEEFISHGLNFVNQTTMILEGVRIFPSFLAPVIEAMIKGRGLDRQYTFEIFRDLVAERESYDSSTAQSPRKPPITLLEGVIDYSIDDRSTQGFVDAVLSTWVISTLAIPVVSCQLLQDLYTQPEYLADLVEESQTVPLRDHEHGQSNEIYDKIGKLPILEAFAMESWRTNCFQSNTAHRVAMKPYEFSDGYKVKAGEAIEFNQHAFLWDESLYPEHKRFDPSRFLNKNKSLVDTGLDWPVWGVPRYICPGRFQVANIEKLLAIYVLQNFEAKFERTKKDLNFEWRDSLVPDPKTILLMRRRSKQ